MKTFCLPLSLKNLPRLATAVTVCAVLTACPADDPEGNDDGSSSSTTQGTTTTATTTTEGTGSSTDAPSSSTTTTGTTDPSTSSGTDGGTTGETGCPTHVSTERVASLVDISFGWTGQGHGADPVDGMVVSYELFDCDDDCRLCRIQGPVANDPSVPIESRRCLNMFPQACTSDADCGGQDGACQVLFQPPLQRTTSWQAAYTPNLTPEEMMDFSTNSPFGVQGVINLDTGELDFEIMNTRAVLGPGSAEFCVGDNTAGDGMADGNCADSDDPCDAATISPNGALSFDCDWDPLLIDFALPAHGMGTSGVRWEMDATRPNCTFPGAESASCWCGVCSDDADRSCIRDSDCPNGTCGNAGTMESPIVTLQNACAPGETCSWDPNQSRGTCMGSSGTTTCFPASGEWEVVGDTSVQDGFVVSTIALLACLPVVDPDRQIIVDPINDISLDEAFGFPGPIIQRLPLKITPEFR